MKTFDRISAVLVGPKRNNVLTGQNNMIEMTSAKSEPTVAIKIPQEPVNVWQLGNA
jgi:hypothetical protein